MLFLFLKVGKPCINKEKSKKCISVFSANFGVILEIEREEMERKSLGNTYLFHALNIAENKEKYDTEVKKILSDKGILSWILKYTVEEFKETELSRIKDCIEGEPEIMAVSIYPGEKISGSPAITGLKNEDAVPNEGKIVYDIRFYALTPNEKRIKLIINIEAQKNYYPGYDLVTRAIFYCARMLSAQLDTEFTAEHYDQIKKVYSIWICMDSPSYAENTITEYKIEQNNLYGEFGKQSRYDLLSAVMIYLSKTDSSGGSLLHQLLSVLLTSQISVKEKVEILSNKYGLEMTEKIEEGVKKMCNLSDLIEEQAIEQGLKKGLQQGLERGIQAMILDNLEEGFPAEKIIKKLQKCFAIEEEMAWKYFNYFSDQK